MRCPDALPRGLLPPSPRVGLAGAHGSRNSGLTLLEAMLVAALISLAVIALAAYRLNTLRGMQQDPAVQVGLVALDLARFKLEELRRLPFPEPAGLGQGKGGGCSPHPLCNDGDNLDQADLQHPDHEDERNPLRPLGERAAPVGGYRLVWNIADDLPVAGMKTVSVLVSWQERGGRRWVELTTAWGRSEQVAGEGFLGAGRE